jgi:hypothetical protein
MLPYRTAGNTQADQVGLVGDCFPGKVYSADHTLDGTNPTQFQLQPKPRGFRISNASADLEFNLDQIPGDRVSTSGRNVLVSEMATNNIFKAGVTDSRLFDPVNPPTNLFIKSATASATFTIEFF